MIKNYLKIAFRHFKKQKGYTFINIAGLAIGMACCILILLWVHDELSFDRYHENADHIYRITYAEEIGGAYDQYAIPPFVAAPTFAADLPEKRIYHAAPFADCPNMKLVNLEKILWSLEDLVHEVTVPPEVAGPARQAIERMLAI